MHPVFTYFVKDICHIKIYTIFETFLLNFMQKNNTNKHQFYLAKTKMTYFLKVSFRRPLLPDKLAFLSDVREWNVVVSAAARWWSGVSGNNKKLSALAHIPECHCKVQTSRKQLHSFKKSIWCIESCCLVVVFFK